MKETNAMLEGVARTYPSSLGKEEREVYAALPSDEERAAFRICRDFAWLPDQGRPPGWFFLAHNHLADRLGIHPMQAHRLMGRMDKSYGLIKLVKKGTRRGLGAPAAAGEYHWQLPPPDPTCQTEGAPR